MTSAADLDPPTRAVLAVLAHAGYVVGVGRDGGAAVVTASDPSGESWTVRGPDVYVALCELAEQAGSDLWDEVVWGVDGRTFSPASAYQASGGCCRLQTQPRRRRYN